MNTTTPETDAVVLNDTGDSGFLAELVKTCRKLERDRDEAKEQLEAMRTATKEAHRFIRNIVKNYECGDEVDTSGEALLAKLQPFTKPGA